MDRQVLISLETLKKYWMDMLPLSTVNEEQRQNQCLADVAQENADQNQKCRTIGSELRSKPSKVECHTSNQPRKDFPFSDNLTTLMFFVANDVINLRESQNPFFSENECHRLHLNLLQQSMFMELF